MGSTTYFDGTALRFPSTFELTLEDIYITLQKTKDTVHPIPCHEGAEG